MFRLTRIRNAFINASLLLLIIAVLITTAPAQESKVKMVSASSRGEVSGNNESLLNPAVPRSALSANGRWVVFESKATDLARGVNDANAASDVFLRDLQTGSTTLVSINSDGTASGNGLSLAPFISQDGRFAAFESFATNLVPEGVRAPKNIFVRDLHQGMTRLVTINALGRPSEGGFLMVNLYGLSADGRFVLFTSEARDLVTNDRNDSADLFVRDMVEAKTFLISVNRAGLASGNRTSLTSGGFFNFTPIIGANGRIVAFTSYANDLVENDKLCIGECDGTNGLPDVFVRDLTNDTTMLVSVNRDGTNGGNGPSQQPSISADGRFVAFRSFAIDLTNNDRTPQADIYVRDLRAGKTVLASVNLTGDNGGTNGRGFGINAQQPLISPDGRFVAFTSAAVDLAPNKTSVLSSDVFVHDLAQGTTTLASVNLKGADTAGPTVSVPADFSADGRYLVFRSNAPELHVADFNQTSDVFMRNMVAGTTILVSINSTGASGNGASLVGDISADGRVIAFDSEATDLAENDNNQAPDVFVHTLAAPPHIDHVKYLPGYLIVLGDNLDREAKLYLDGSELKPLGRFRRKLVARGVKLAPGIHEVQVVNEDGQAARTFVSASARF